VLLQDNNLDPGTGKQQGMNKAGGAATRDTDLSLQYSRHEPDPTCENWAPAGCQKAPVA
jgi:hypothetical protein